MTAKSSDMGVRMLKSVDMKSSWIGVPTAVVLLTTAGATSAHGGPEPTAPVDEVVVVGGPGPKIVTSFPADGADVPAGVLVLKVVFDQPMTPEAWSYGRSEAGAFPSCLAQPRLLSDQRTFVLLCTVAPHRTYAVELNGTPDFVSSKGRSAEPTLLHFSTTETGPRSMHDALLQAGLTDVDEPIMSWRDDGAGVSRSPPPSPERLVKTRP